MSTQPSGSYENGGHSAEKTQIQRGETPGGQSALQNQSEPGVGFQPLASAEGGAGDEERRGVGLSSVGQVGAGVSVKPALN